MLRTYAPVAVPERHRVVALYQDYAPIAQAANAAFLPVAGIFEAVLLLLFVAARPHPAPRHAADPPPDGARSSTGRTTTSSRGCRTGRSSLARGAEVDAAASAQETAVACSCSTSTTSRRSTTRSATSGRPAPAGARRAAARAVRRRASPASAATSSPSCSPAPTADEAHRPPADPHRLEQPFDLERIPAGDRGQHRHRRLPGARRRRGHARSSARTSRCTSRRTRTRAPRLYDPEQDTSDAGPPGPRSASCAARSRSASSSSTTSRRPSSRPARIAGVEALVRWQHPNRGFIPPDEFVPIAERSGPDQALEHLRPRDGRAPVRGTGRRPGATCTWPST